ncbi:hypothetical protein MtrunA17_Chr3g0127541 [Medicago truncatula]|uniref:Uncharacterized protein n=1 Tax=Medicago truncatula TaxID=3880 RepID=A0A396IW73_MEDTR|nr:hypothetical protein MtrunA17_Chr3g0127541 [Medicago truncatula]
MACLRPSALLISALLIIKLFLDQYVVHKFYLSGRKTLILKEIVVEAYNSVE